MLPLLQYINNSTTATGVQHFRRCSSSRSTTRQAVLIRMNHQRSIQIGFFVLPLDVIRLIAHMLPPVSVVLLASTSKNSPLSVEVATIPFWERTMGFSFEAAQLMTAVIYNAKSPHAVSIINSKEFSSWKHKLCNTRGMVFAHTLALRILTGLKRSIIDELIVQQHESSSAVVYHALLVVIQYLQSSYISRDLYRESISELIRKHHRIFIPRIIAPQYSAAQTSSFLSSLWRWATRSNEAASVPSSSNYSLSASDSDLVPHAAAFSLLSFFPRSKPNSPYDHLSTLLEKAINDRNSRMLPSRWRLAAVRASGMIRASFDPLEIHFEVLPEENCIAFRGAIVTGGATFAGKYYRNDRICKYRFGLRSTSFPGEAQSTEQIAFVSDTYGGFLGFWMLLRVPSTSYPSSEIVEVKGEKRQLVAAVVGVFPDL